jgi:hypothetical protein
MECGGWPSLWALDGPSGSLPAPAGAEDGLFHEYLPGCGDCVLPASGIQAPCADVFENIDPPEGGAVIKEGVT